MWDEPLVIATRSFRSRLVVGAERYPSEEIMRRSHDAAGSELVTLAVRDLDLASPGGSLLASIDQGRFTLVAATTGCRTADEAVRTAYLARESGLGDFVKIDVVGDARTEMPDLPAVLEATRTLSRDGFVALPVAGDDPVAARRLEEAGAAAILLQPAPAGSGLGVRNPYAIRLDPRHGDGSGHRGRAGSAPPRMRRSPWSWAATPCWWARPSPRRATRRSWRKRCATRWRLAGRPTRPGASPGDSTGTRSGRRIERSRAAGHRLAPGQLSRPDAVVVGAGAIGAACAYELACAGLSVVVIERTTPGAEASGASAGILSVPDRSRRDPVALLGRLSRDLHEPLATALREESGIDVGLGRTGHLRLCMTPEEVRQAERVASDPAAHEEGISLVGQDDLRRLEPAVSRAALGALHLSRSSWVDNVQLVRALVRAGERRGVRYLIGQPVDALVRTGSRITGVRAGTLGTIEAGTVILAAGAWSGAIEGAPAELTVRPGQGADSGAGQCGRTDPPRHLPRRRLRGSAAVGGMSVRRDRRGRSRRSGRDARRPGVAPERGVRHGARDRFSPFPARAGRV